MANGSLPSSVKKLFWDLNPRALRWDRDREQIIGRILASGPWETVKWLRSTAGDEAIRSWIEEHEGRGLSPGNSVSGRSSSRFPDAGSMRG
jgi:hypothetical protein